MSSQGKEGNYILVVDRSYPFFKDRKIIVMTEDKREEIRVPDGLIVCDICNAEIVDEKVMLLCFEDHIWGVICKRCRENYYPDFEVRVKKEIEK